MTTIAYKDGVLSTDSQVSAGSCYSYHIDKLVRVDEHDCWLSMCGTVAHFKDFLRWFRADEEDRDEIEVPEFEPDSFGAVVLFDDGRVHMYDEQFDYLDHPADKPLAVGSGAAAALGAMYAGVSAADSVRIASLIDLATGGEVLTVTAGYKPPRKKKKKAPAKNSPKRR